jgi:hypothetical protein
MLLVVLGLQRSIWCKPSNLASHVFYMILVDNNGCSTDSIGLVFSLARSNCNYFCHVFHIRLVHCKVHVVRTFCNDATWLIWSPAHHRTSSVAKDNWNILYILVLDDLQYRCRGNSFGVQAFRKPILLWSRSHCYWWIWIWEYVLICVLNVSTIKNA